MHISHKPNFPQLAAINDSIKKLDAMEIDSVCNNTYGQKRKRMSAVTYKIFLRSFSLIGFSHRAGAAEWGVFHPCVGVVHMGPKICMCVPLVVLLFDVFIRANKTVFGVRSLEK